MNGSCLLPLQANCRFRGENMAVTVVYRASKIITMDPTRPEATHRRYYSCCGVLSQAIYPREGQSGRYTIISG